MEPDCFFLLQVYLAILLTIAYRNVDHLDSPRNITQVHVVVRDDSSRLTAGDQQEAESMKHTFIRSMWTRGRWVIKNERWQLQNVPGKTHTSGAGELLGWYKLY